MPYGREEADTQHRLKSKVVWISVVAQVVSILITLGVIDMGMGDTLNAVAVSICELLVVFGVLNNPTDSGAF